MLLRKQTPIERTPVLEPLQTAPEETPEKKTKFDWDETIKEDVLEVGWLEGASWQDNSGFTEKPN